MLFYLGIHKSPRAPRRVAQMEVAMREGHEGRNKCISEMTRVA